ncbi:nucleotidyltransferase domain-containing protein [Saccharicrinis sp. FJH2]|uniref:nucleotidyltransferase domain-containing protein n=1 Tax=Saccharicrinis sp. FJH65 TaxID=3344659 RepID=UPI0035F22F02
MAVKIDIEKLIKDTVIQIAPEATVILYGSMARGDFNENSDVDILILLNKDIVTMEDEKRVKYPLYDIEFEIGKIISPLVLSKSVWESKHKITPFYQNVMREGIVL